MGALAGDGRPDLAVANYETDSVSSLLNKGGGSFAYKTAWVACLNPVSLALADFDRDGKLDVAVVCAGSNNLVVYRGIGDGTFAASAMTYAAGGPSRSVAVGDFDGDGWPDVATVTSASTGSAASASDGVSV